MSVLLLAILLSAPWTVGQSTFGGIVGAVKDASQSAVAGAQLTLTSLDDRTQRNASTDGNGGFEFVNLKPGRYELAVQADGFAEYKIAATQLDARQTLRIDVVLKLASSAQSIEVGGDVGPVINTENAKIGDTKNFAQITNLPVNYRGAATSPLAMLVTVPGAHQDANGNENSGISTRSCVQIGADNNSTLRPRKSSPPA